MAADDAERALALSYAGEGREALAALFALDDALGLVLRTTREPMLGQMRLAWWREALARLDHAPAPAEPVLQGIASRVLPRGVSGEALVPIVHGWEVLIEEDRLDAEALRRFAEGRGTLFEVAGQAIGAKGDPLRVAGQGWALADLARNLKDDGEVTTARRQALDLLGAATAQRWSRRGRALGALAHLALRDLDKPEPVAAPGRVGRMLWHRLTGR